MRYLVIAVLGMMLLVTAAVFTLPHLAGGEFVTQQLQQAVARSTGRTLTLLKAPSVQVFPDAQSERRGRVACPTRTGMFNGTTVSMERLDAKISLWQLLSRRADVQELTLVRPRLTLVIDKQGQVNWQLPQGPARPDSAAQPQPARRLRQRRYRLRQCALSMAKSPSMTSAPAPAFAVQAVNATVSVPAGRQALERRRVTARWNGQRVNLKLFLKDIARLTQSGSPVELALDAQPAPGGGVGPVEAGRADSTSPDRPTSPRPTCASWPEWGGWHVTGAGRRTERLFSAQGALALGGRQGRAQQCQHQPRRHEGQRAGAGADAQ
jgi:hypothetical protein